MNHSTARPDRPMCTCGEERRGEAVVMHLLAQANSLRIPLADQSVHMCCCSPPYWGLRDYGIPGQLGLEPTPDEFIRTMTAVFREVWRVLRDDGTCWVNMGDSYNGNRSEVGHILPSETRERTRSKALTGGVIPPQGSAPRCRDLKAKDLCGIPWRLAFALQADGWYLRSDIIWAKPNPMPESVTDRPTKSHEYMFLLSKQERYYFDADAVREEHAEPWRGKGESDASMSPESWDAAREDAARSGKAKRINGSAGIREYNPAGRNIRTVWTIPTESYAGAHFATFPRKLVEPCIKAGTSEKGCCPVCGAGWVREVAAAKYEPETVDVGVRFVDGSRGDKTRKLNGKSAEWKNAAASRSTTGWRPGCKCHDTLETAVPYPCTVLDPFAGSGTTIVVANALGRNGVGLDLSRQYLGLAARRITRPHARVERPVRDDSIRDQPGQGRLF